MISDQSLLLSTNVLNDIISNTNDGMYVFTTGTYTGVTGVSVLE